MGLLNLFAHRRAGVLRLPSGCFTVDREGRVVVATLPQQFPDALLQEISRRVLETFRAAYAAQSPLSELILYYPSLKITARELRGGAIVYLSPQSPISPLR